MKKILLLISLISVITTLLAHEYILLAYKYKINKGDTLEMHLFVADGFNVQLERPLQKSLTKKFELITNHGTEDLLANTNDQSLPVINKPINFDGLGLIHMERDYARIALPTKEFINYLKEDHVENIHVDSTINKPQRERYSRYLKALIISGKSDNDTLFKAITGQALEIVLLQNPYALKLNDKIEAQVFFMGKPLINKTITARNRTGSEPSIMQNAKTDVNGKCTFKLIRSGEWFIHLTHMIPCADKKDSDWESFWASYSFGM